MDLIKNFDGRMSLFLAISDQGIDNYFLDFKPMRSTIGTILRQDDEKKFV